MEKLYPFSRIKNKTPKNGGFIVKQNFDDEVWMIEYNSEMILKSLQDKNPAEDFSDFPEITKEQLINLLILATYNIVRVHNFVLGEKGSKL